MSIINIRKHYVNISQMMFHIHFKIFQCDLDMLYVTSQFIGVVLSSHILMQKYNIDFYQVATRLAVAYLCLTMVGSHYKTHSNGSIPWLVLITLHVSYAYATRPFLIFIYQQTWIVKLESSWTHDRLHLIK